MPLAGLSVALAGLSVALAGLSVALAGLSVALAGLSVALAGLSVALAGLSVPKNVRRHTVLQLDQRHAQARVPAETGSRLLRSRFGIRTSALNGVFVCEIVCLFVRCSPR